MKRRILAIDPGDQVSGYVVVEHDGREITRVIDKGKIENEGMYRVIANNASVDCIADMAIEMVASYGMAVGKNVFDTCVWIGRFIENATILGMWHKQIYRKEEKITLCNSLKAKDANIRQALIDRYAPHTANGGKGTKKEPGFFYGFKSDIWAAMAVAVTYFDMYVREVQSDER